MANIVLDFLHNYETGERRESEPANAYQYDEGHVLEAILPKVITAAEIHYWIRGMETADAYVPTSITPNGNNSCTVLGNIPNKYFETNGELRIYIVINDADASITTYEGFVHICQRSMPDDYVDDDPENEATRILTDARAAAATATAAAQTAQDVADSIPADYSQLSEDVSTLKEDLSSMQTATASDVGKALKAKTVSGGKVTEWEFGVAGSGLTDTQKELIITILRNAMYTSDQSKNIDDLEDAFANTVISISAALDLRGNTIYSDDTLDTLRQYLVVRATYDDGSTQTVTGYALSGTFTVGTSTIQVIYRDAAASVNVPVSQAVVRYTVTNNLTGVTNSNTDVTIAEGNTYTGILTAETTGYIPTNVSVTVGGTDVASTVYDSSTHTITIANVQGDIVIVASEAEDPYAPKFELTSPLIVGDTTDPRINDTANNRIATGVTVNDNENWTICLDFTSLLDGAVQGRWVLQNNNNQVSISYASPNWIGGWHGAGPAVMNDYAGGKWKGLNFVVIMTHESNTLSVNVYGAATHTITRTSIATPSNGQVYIGNTYQMGTINRCAIYKRVLTADEITAWIGE